MNENPIISIIIPIYNVEKYLKEALDSVKGQTYHNFEVIMVNDGSTDNSLNIARNFLEDSRFKLIDSKVNEGLSVARNKGISIAKGKLIYFFDSDDVLSLNLLEYLVKYFSDNIDLISFNYHNLQNKDKKIIKKVTSVKEYSNIGCLKLLLNDEIARAPWSYIFRRQLLDNKDIRFPKGRNFEDITFNPKLFNKIRRMKVIKFEPAGYFYREGRKGSIVNDLTGKKLEKQMEDKLYLYKQKYDYLIQNTNLNIKDISNWYINELISTYVEYYHDVSGNKEKLKEDIFVSYVQEIRKNKYNFKYFNLKNKLKYFIFTNSFLRKLLLI